VVDGGTAGSMSSIEQVKSVATNALGETVVTGDFYTSSSAAPDAFVTRFNADGSVAWTRVFGGSGKDFGNRVVLAPSGTVYVVGRTESSSISVVQPPAAVTTTGTYSDSPDAYLARLTSDGQLTAFVYLGGSSEESGYGLAVDPSDERRVYVAGKSNSPLLPGGEDGGREDGMDGFVTLVDFSRTPPIAWTRYLGSPKVDVLSRNDEAYTVAFRDGSLYLGGQVRAEVQGIPRGTNYRGEYDGFAAKLNTTTGRFEWIVYLGGSDDDEVVDILARPDGGIVAVGNTLSRDYPTAGSGQGAFAVRITEQGQLDGTGLRLGDGGIQVERTPAALDSLGNVYIGGTTSSATSLLGVNGFDSTLNSSTDGFILMLDAKVEKVLWSSYVGGGSSATREWVRGVSAGPGGQLTLGGQTSSADLLTVDAGHDLAWNGAEDGFVFRLEVDPSEPIPGSVNPGASAQGRLTPSWEGFSDPQTGIVDYAWAVTSGGGLDGGVLERDFQSVGTNPFVPPANGFQMGAGKTYFVTVRASNGVGRSTMATSVGVPGPTDAGDGGEPGTDLDPEPVDLQSPLGWGCGSTGGGGLAGALGLVALASLLARRARRASTSER